MKNVFQKKLAEKIHLKAIEIQILEINNNNINKNNNSNGKNNSKSNDNLKTCYYVFLSLLIKLFIDFH